MTIFNNDTPRVCPTCNAIINEDDTVDNCAGECDREINLREDYSELDFSDEVVRDLPDFEFDEPDDYWEDDDDEEGHWQ